MSNQNSNDNPTVLYLNPIGISAYDDTFVNMIKTYREPDTHAYVASLDPEVVPPGMTDLEFRVYESCIINETVKAAVYADDHGLDAMVIGCFYDPALEDCREISNGPVIIAPCQAAISTALNLANTYSVIIGEWKWENQMKDTICRYGYDSQLVSFEALGLRVEDFHQNPDVTRQKLLQAAKQAADKRAEAIVLGCTLEVGFYKDIQDYLTSQGYAIPVIDCSIAAFKVAENAARMKRVVGISTGNSWGMAAPTRDELKKFGVLQVPIKFGNFSEIPPVS